MHILVDFSAAYEGGAISAAKADSKNSVVMAAVNRCDIQKQMQNQEIRTWLITWLISIPRGF
jgi:hypothetical protein